MHKDFQLELRKRAITNSNDIEDLRQLALMLLNQNSLLQDMLQREMARGLGLEQQ
jgi:hypothetical protein